MSFALRYAARSDVGLVRSNNQDSGYAGGHLLVVADGMGGHAGGDVASSVAIGHLSGLDSDTPASDIVASLEETVLEANQEILDRKSTRLNSSHVAISYAVFCLKKKKIIQDTMDNRTTKN